MKIKAGQYFYTYSTMYKCFRIKKADRECDIPYRHSGSACNESNYYTREAAMKRVCELNGWEYTPKQNDSSNE